MALLAAEAVLVVLLLALGVGPTRSAGAAAALGCTSFGARGAAELLFDSNVKEVGFVGARRAELGAF